MEDEFDSYYDDDGGVFALVNKFESMMKSGKYYYYDLEDFASIISYFSSDRPDYAYAALQMARKQHPPSAELDLIEAKYLYKTNKHHKSLEILNNISNDSIYDPEILEQKAELYSRLKKEKLAAECYKILTQTRFDEETRFEAYMSLADSYNSMGNMKKWEETLLEAHENWPATPAPIDELIAVFDLTGNQEKVLFYTNKLVDMDPFNHYYWTALGSQYYYNAQLDEAQKALEYAILLFEDAPPERNPEFDENGDRYEDEYRQPVGDDAIYYMGLIYLEKGEYQKALDNFTSIKPYDDGFTNFSFYIAECHANLGDYEMAEIFYRKSIRNKPDNPLNYYSYGLMLDSIGRSKEAYKLIENAISIEYEESTLISEMYYSLAQVAHNALMYSESQDAYNKTIELNQTESDVWIDYAELLFDQDKIEEMEDVIHRGIIHNPTAAEIYFRYAAYLFILGQPLDALDIMSVGIELNPSELEGFFDYYPQAREIQAVIDLLSSFNL